MSDLGNILTRFLAPLRARVLLMLARALVRAVEESGGAQALQVQVLAEETLERVENPQLYGHASRPLPGSEVFLAFLGGDRSHGFVVADGDRRYRPRDLEPGEVIVYSHENNLGDEEERPEWLSEPLEGQPAQGMHCIRLKPGREVEICCAKLTITVNGVPSEIGAEGAAGGVFEDLAQVGRDKIVIPIGDSAGTYYIERGP